MSRRTILATLCLVTALLALIVLPAGVALSADVLEVMVRNFPQVQEIEGGVTVEEIPPGGTAEQFTGVIVPRVDRNDTTRLIEAGTFRAEGFRHVTVSIAGLVKGEPLQPPTIGAFVIPDERLVQQAFDERGFMMFAEEIQASGSKDQGPYLWSEARTFDVGHGRYRVLLYNLSDKTIEVDVYAYLTN